MFDTLLMTNEILKLTFLSGRVSNLSVRNVAYIFCSNLHVFIIHNLNEQRRCKFYIHLTFNKYSIKSKVQVLLIKNMTLEFELHICTHICFFFFGLFFFKLPYKLVKRVKICLGLSQECDRMYNMEVKSFCGAKLNQALSL